MPWNEGFPSPEELEAVETEEVAKEAEFADKPKDEAPNIDAELVEQPKKKGKK